MGVDFSLRVLKKEGNQLTQLSGPEVPPADTRDWNLFPLFHEKDREQVERLLDHKVSYEFFDKRNASCYGDETNKNLYFSPEVVLDTVKTTKEALERNKDKFPLKYWFSEKGGKDFSGKVFLNGQIVNLTGAPTKDKHIKIGSQKIDLSNPIEIKCKKVVTKKEGDKIIEIEGDEITLEIKSRTYDEQFKQILEDMIRVCEFAKSKGYYVQGAMW
jgi:hypothetical protein